MGWTIRLEDEEGEIVSQLGSEFEEQDFDGKEYKLLHYLDPYGDTKFNHRQIPNLISDFEHLQMIDTNPQINEIIDLAIKCANGVHLYLVFYGD